MAGRELRHPPGVQVAGKIDGPSEVMATSSPLARAPSGPLLTSVTFHAKFDEVSFGETVRVVGNHPSIGSWDPEKGAVLATTQETFPAWMNKEPALIETFTTVEYKYVTVSKEGHVKWEPCAGNRTFITTGPEMAVEDDGGLYRQHHSQAEPEEEEEEDGDDDTALALAHRTPEMRKQVFQQKLGMVEDLEGEVLIDAHATVFMVALQLPLKLVKVNGKWTVEVKAPTDGRNFAWLPLVEEFRKKSKVRIVCVGWPGVHPESFSEQSEIERLLTKHNCIPVFPPKQDFEKYVNFCAAYMWPVFHDVMNFFQSATPLAFDEHGWAAYQHVNNLYANAVVPHTHESDIIWVHDYHMMMTPTFICRKLVKANVGFYLHTPFPSSDSFKSLPIVEELLSGMLCADQCGFQFFAYARNFLVSVKKVMGLEPTYKSGGFIGLEYNGRLVMLKVAHFVYPFVDTRSKLLSDQFEDKTAQVKALFQGKTVFASMDRCDNLSGLIPKFRAFKRFLAMHPEYRGKAVLVQYTFESTTGYDELGHLLDALRDQADAFLQVDDSGSMRIVDKGDPSESDIYLRVEKVDRTDRLALFRAADVLLDTSVKAGLNLMPFEFITAHHDDKEDHPVTIISEFTGCSRVLLGAIRVNPWNQLDVVNGCDRALKMTATEKQEMHTCNLQYVSESSPIEWFKDFLMDLRRARKKEGIRIESIGFGAKIRQVCMTQNFQKLSTESVLAAYRNAKRRVLFLDNEGTLAADERQMYREHGAPKGGVSDLKSRGSPPDEQVLKCLRSLCQDPRNTVVILSGRDRGMLEEWFASVPQIGLAAERGFYYKLPLLGSQWHCMKQNPDNTWQSYAFEIMREFVKRTQGSFIESKGSALVWQFRDVDPHFGSMQAKELSTHLKELLFGFEVDVLNGKGYVEVKLRGINKGVAVTKVLHKVTALCGEVDFVLCVGDDRSDEDMFEAIAAFAAPPADEVGSDNNESSQLSTTDGESDGHPEGDRKLESLEEEPALVKSESFWSKQRKGISNLSGLSQMGKSGDFRKMGSGGGGLCDELGGSSGSMERFFTCTVGRKPSAAKFYLDDTDEVSELLNSIMLSQQKREHTPSNYHTWSGGDLRPGMRVGSMPALSSLAFGPRRLPSKC